MRSDISFYLGGFHAVIRVQRNVPQGHWNGQTFTGVDAAAVAFSIITRHRARMSANMASHD